MSELTQRITDYLSSGGLFNPELADHNAVRDLLIDCRDALSPTLRQDCSGGMPCTDCPDKRKCQAGCIRQGEALAAPTAPTEPVTLTKEEIEDIAAACYCSLDREVDDFKIVFAREIERIVSARYATPPSAVEAAQPEAVALPRTNSIEASAVMDSVLAAYNWPTNPKNAARAGFEACLKLLAAAPTTEATSSSDAERLDAARWRCFLSSTMPEHEHAEATALVDAAMTKGGRL